MTAVTKSISITLLFLLAIAGVILAAPSVNSYFHNLDGHQHSDQSTWKPLNNGMPGWSNKVQPF